MRQHSAEEKEALDAFNTQRAMLNAIADRNVHDPAFMKWRIVTQEVFKQYLPAYLVRFININFTHRSYTGDPQETYDAGIQASKACIEAAVERIERWGLDRLAPKQEPAQKPEPSETGAGLHFHGQVTIQNLAVAADSATQNVNQSAGTEAVALREIGGILRESGELRQKEVAQALEIIEKLATEMHKPKTGWDWKSIADGTNTLLGIMKNATDAITTLAPHLPVIVGLFDTARKMLG